MKIKEEFDTNLIMWVKWKCETKVEGQWGIWKSSISDNHLHTQISILMISLKGAATPTTNNNSEVHVSLDPIIHNLRNNHHQGSALWPQN